MNQVIDFNWLVFGLSLAVSFLFGLFYALLVRLLSKLGVQGQTAILVAFGVGAILLLAVPMIGLLNAGILLAYFSASGIFMVIEYAHRVHLERQRDKNAATQIAEEALKHDDQTANR